MILNFRQGVVSGDKTVTGDPDFIQFTGSDYRLSTDNEPLVVALAHGTTNYLHTETSNVTGWNIVSEDTWLYIEIDLITAQRTFGSTNVEPVYGPTAPLAPADNLHWFNTTDNTMYFWNNATTQWFEVIRVMVAKVDATNTITYYPFGTQVAISSVTPIYNTGRIFYDVTGEALYRPNQSFLTTEDQMMVSGTVAQSIRLESNAVVAKAAYPIPAFHVVKYSNFETVELANYEDTGTTVLAMATTEANTGEIIQVTVQGVITNPAWDFQTVGVPLWVDLTGDLVDVDPNITNNNRPAQVPVARVLSKTSIIFEQGLGGKGEKGLSGDVAGIHPASTSVAGVARLSTAPTNALDPIVVGNNDLRLSDARASLPHIHDAADVTVAPYGSVAAANVQDALEEVDTTVLHLSGGTLTGDLILNDDPTVNLGAVTKQYVDSRVSGLSWIDPICLVNMISDTQTTPPISPEISDAYIVGAGGSGVWSGLDGNIVIWDGAAWLDRGALSSFSTTRRFGVAMESNTTPSGTFAGHKNDIAIYDPNTMSWTFYVPSNTNAVWVCNELSLHAYHQYAYDGTKWIEFGGTTAVSPGTNLELSGNSLNVIDYSNGGTIEAETLQGSIPSDFASASSVNTLGYKHNQTASSATWNINHNLNTQFVNISVYIDNAGTIELITPSSIVINDNNNVTVSFSSAFIGHAAIIGIL